MQLKQYQVNTLETLKKFFEMSRIYGHKEAYKKITSTPEIKARLGKLCDDYIHWDSIPNTPRVCLKVPTGGGKTIIAAHSIKIAGQTWLEKEYPVVLWFTPTDTIRKQTSEALKNPRHPYREAIDEQFNGKVKIFDIDEKFNIRPQDIKDNVCIVVSTIQSFSKKDTSKYNVYKHNENLEPHFTKISSKDGMELTEDGMLKYSFANLLNHHKPLMIVDEAHNALTNLSAEMQGRISPSAVIELSATPRLQNNTLYSVKAIELKEEEMIKLPIVVTEHLDWKLAVTESIAKREELEKESQSESDYIRPILLFQAQDIKGDNNVENLLKHLEDEQNISRDEIAIATGDQKELDGLNLFSPDCKVKYIITVQALKEGWDCSFAYVLCSLSNVKSGTAVEQLLGRVMRMPYARSRKNLSLNKAYAYVLSQKFGESTDVIVKKLANKGFSDEDSKTVVEQKPMDIGLFGCMDFNKINLDLNTVIKEKDLPPSIELKRETDGSNSLVITNQTTDKDIEVVKTMLDEVKIFELETKFNSYKSNSLEPSYASSGETFTLPKMKVEVQGEFELAFPDTSFEYFEWNLEDYASYKLEPDEFIIDKQGNDFKIDIDGNRLQYSYDNKEQTTMYFINSDNWTPEHLINWLSKQLRDSYFSQPVIVGWVTKVVHYLINNRNLNIADLMIAKYVIVNKLKVKINNAINKAKIDAFQQLFFEETSKIELDFDNNFKFYDNMYDDISQYYRGNYKFNKHYFGSKRVPSFDGSSNGEEFLCAKAIDNNPNVKYWIRNVSRHVNSFWLPTSTDKFYPDFVVLLNDGRVLVVEYKGAHLSGSADTLEKKSIGSLWSKNSKGNCLFLLAEKEKDNLNVNEQINQIIK